MERRIINMAELEGVKCVVELGPGTGGTTRAILEAMPADARLLTIEVDAEFTAILEQLGDPRLVAHTGSAEDLEAILKQYGLPSPDVVISGIPFSTMPRETASGIIEAVRDALPDNGRFLAYQFRGLVGRLGRPILGEFEFEFEPLNVPPMRFYLWRRRLDAVTAA